MMSFGIESSVRPDMVPEMVGFDMVGLVTVTLEMLVIRLVEEIMRNNSSLCACWFLDMRSRAS